MNFIRHLALLAAVVISGTAMAQQAAMERVQFASGQSSTTVRSTLRGFDSIEYLVGAGAGQRMVVNIDRIALPNLKS